MSVAGTYAKALYETLKGANGSADPVDKVRDALTEFAALLEGSKDAQIALYGPATSAREKSAIIGQLSARCGHPAMVKNFLLLLAKKGRLNVLPDIPMALDEARLTAEGGTLGQVVSADPMNQSDVKELEDAFSKKLNRKVELKATTDPALLAGVRVTVAGTTYDGTLRSQLNRLQESFVSGSQQIH